MATGLSSSDSNTKLEMPLLVLNLGTLQEGEGICSTRLSQSRNREPKPIFWSADEYVLTSIIRTYQHANTENGHDQILPNPIQHDTQHVNAVPICGSHLDVNLEND